MIAGMLPVFTGIHHRARLPGPVVRPLGYRATWRKAAAVLPKRSMTFGEALDVCVCVHMSYRYTYMCMYVSIYIYRYIYI